MIILALKRFHFTGGDEKTKCQREYLAASKNPGSGHFKPRCDLNGSYADVQCRGSDCYCADKDGNEIVGTKTPVVSGKPNCKKPCMFRCLLRFERFNFSVP